MRARSLENGGNAATASIDRGRLDFAAPDLDTRFLHCVTAMRSVQPGSVLPEGVLVSKGRQAAVPGGQIALLGPLDEGPPLPAKNSDRACNAGDAFSAAVVWCIAKRMMTLQR